MAFELKCPSVEELEKYLDFYQNQQHSQERNDFLSLEQHLQTCSSCQKQIQKLQSKQCSLPTATTSEGGNHIIAGCKLLEKIGGGAMGDVFKALKLSLNRIVAVKVLHSGQLEGSNNNTHTERFLREAQTLAQLDHTNIASVYDYYISPDQKNYYLIMQFIDGKDIEKYVEENGPIPLERAIPIWIQILEGIQALHDVDIIHRDVKPSNILLDTREKIKIIDFGLAKTQNLDGQITMHSGILGTPRYMSPEACRGEAQTIQSDIYSLGGVFYFTLTGKPPFSGKTIPELIYQHVYKEPPLLSQEVSNISPEVEQFFQKILAKTYDVRYQTCKEVLATISKFSFLEESSTTSSPNETSNSPISRNLRTKNVNFFIKKNSSSSDNSPILQKPSARTPSSFALKPFSSTSTPTSTPPQTTQVSQATSSLQPTHLLSISQKGTQKLIDHSFSTTNPQPDTQRITTSGTSSELSLSNHTKAKEDKNISETERLKPSIREVPLKTPKQIFQRSLSTSVQEPLNLAESVSLPTVSAETNFEPVTFSFNNTHSNQIEENLCDRCKKNKPITQFFQCKSCKKRKCFQHQRAFLQCETCFSFRSKTHPFYEKINTLLGGNYSTLPTPEPKGKLSYTALAEIFHLLSQENPGNGLLVIGNQDRKKGFCFMHKTLMIMSFGEKSTGKLGDIFLKKALVTPTQIESALKLQKEQGLKFGEALIHLKFITEEDLSEVLISQLCQEILSITFWKNSTYKFKAGDIPEAMQQSMSLDFCVELERIQDFKSALASFFHHYSLIFSLGIFTFQSSVGYLKLATSEDNICLTEFETDESFEHHLKVKDDPSEFTLSSWKNLSTESFLAQEQQKKTLDYFGTQMFRFLDNPQTCKFEETSSLAKCLDVLPDNLLDVFYNVLGKIGTLQPPLETKEVFSLVSFCSSSEDIFEQLWLRLSQALELSRLVRLFNTFESSLLAMILIKSHFFNYGNQLQKLSSLMLQQGLGREAIPLLTCALEIMPTNPVLQKQLAQTYEQLHLNKNAIEEYSKLLLLLKNKPQEFLECAKKLLQLDPKNSEVATLMIDYYLDFKQFSQAVAIFNTSKSFLSQEEYLRFSWKLIEQEDPPRNITLRQDLLRFYLEQNQLKGIFKTLTTLETVLIRTRHKEKLNLLYEMFSSYHSKRSEELKIKLKNLKEGSIF